MSPTGFVEPKARSNVVLYERNFIYTDLKIQLVHCIPAVTPIKAIMISTYRCQKNVMIEKAVPAGILKHPQ